MARKNYDDIKSRITPVAEMDLHLKVLLYGRAGTGKTTLAGTFPGPILILDVSEHGTSSIADVEGAEVLSVKNFEDIEMAYWMLNSGDHPYSTVVIDSLTMVQQTILKQVMEDKSASKMTQQLWGEVSGKLNNTILTYRDLPMHTVFICQDRTRKDDGEDSEQLDPEVGPALMPSSAKLLNGAVSIIGNTYIKEVTKQKDGQLIKRMEYHLRIGPHHIYITKVRSPIDSKIPRSIKNPTYEDLVAITKGEYNG